MTSCHIARLNFVISLINVLLRQFLYGNTSQPKCLNSFHWLDLTVMVYKLDVGVNRSTYEQTKTVKTQPQWTKKYWVCLKRGKTSYLPVCSTLAFLWGT